MEDEKLLEADEEEKKKIVEDCLHSYFSELMTEVRSDQEYTDVIFEIGPEKKIFRAHQFLFSTQSKKLFELIVNSETSENGCKIVRLNDASPEVFDKVLEVW